MKKKKICFITHSHPTQLGGVSIFHKNLINYLKTKNFDITWAYFGEKDYKYKSGKINFVEIKESLFQLKFVKNNWKIRKFLKKNDFDIVFCTGGLWTFFYLKPIHQKLIHVYHGTVYHFNKNHTKRLNKMLKILFSPILFLSKLSEYPSYDSDKIVCVSNKVKNQVKDLYLEDKVEVIRTGVNTKEFKPRKSYKQKDMLYGLYIGKGSYWTKGLDRTIKLSKEIYKLNHKYRLIIIERSARSRWNTGPDSIARSDRRPARTGRLAGPGDPCWAFLLPGCRNIRVHERCVGPS